MPARVIGIASAKARIRLTTIRWRNSHHHRGALVVDVTEQAQEFGGKIGIEIAGGLVRENQPGLVGESASDRNPLLLTPRKSVGQRRLAVLESEPLEHLQRPVLSLSRWKAMEAQHKGDVLEYRLAPEQLEVLENDTDLAPQGGQPAARQRVEITARYPDLSRGGSLGRIE